MTISECNGEGSQNARHERMRVRTSDVDVRAAESDQIQVPQKMTEAEGADRSSS
jgi:hypothetical protein